MLPLLASGRSCRKALEFEVHCPVAKQSDHSGHDRRTLSRAESRIDLRHVHCAGRALPLPVLSDEDVRTPSLHVRAPTAAGVENRVPLVQLDGWRQHDGGHHHAGLWRTCAAHRLDGDDLRGAVLGSFLLCAPGRPHPRLPWPYVALLPRRIHRQRSPLRLRGLVSVLVLRHTRARRQAFSRHRLPPHGGVCRCVYAAAHCHAAAP
mmetsp:Transcript_114084/g.170629  ORF Transcript_114084/g.170629 Transcript_114084/m.170629 type:complete len:206 (+) Transcript_114084:251-868(+)